MCTLFYPKSFSKTHDFPSGGRKVYGWNACSSQGDKCQPWCMQIKPRQQVVKGVRTPFDRIAWEGRVGASLEEARVCLLQRENLCFAWKTRVQTSVRSRGVYDCLGDNL